MRNVHFSFQSGRAWGTIVLLSQTFAGCAYASSTHRPAPTRGSQPAQLMCLRLVALDSLMYWSEPDCLVVMVKTSAKPMSVEL